MPVVDHVLKWLECRRSQLWELATCLSRRSWFDTVISDIRHTRDVFIFARMAIGKARKDFPKHMLLPFFELLTEFAEESIPYFDQEQNFQKF